MYMQQKYISSELDSKSLALEEKLEDVPTLTPIVYYVYAYELGLKDFQERPALQGIQGLPSIGELCTAMLLVGPGANLVQCLPCKHAGGV